MKTHVVLQISGKQYLCQAGDELLVEHIERNPEEIIEVPVLLSFSEDGESLDVSPKK